jgi:hypothetical protein
VLGALVRDDAADAAGSNNKNLLHDEVSGSWRRSMERSTTISGCREHLPEGQRDHRQDQ